jgi:hypothetical protein
VTRSGKDRGTRVPVPASVERALDRALDTALSLQRPVVLAYLDRVRRKRPDAAPADVVAQLERRYRTTVIGTGAASGGTAALPAVGTAASIATGAAEITAFVSATALYVLALAEVYGVPVGDPQVRRALVLTVLLGDVGEAALAGAELDVRHWARVLGHTTSKDTVQAINARLAHLFVTRFGARQGALMAGRALPFGVGAGVGALGNAALGGSVIRSARRAFGPPPAQFPGRIVDSDAWRHPGRSWRRALPGRHDPDATDG